MHVHITSVYQIIPNQTRQKCITYRPFKVALKKNAP